MALRDMISSVLVAAKELLDRIFSTEQRERLVAFLLADRLVGSLIATIALFVSAPLLFFVGYVVALFAIHVGTALLSFVFWTTSGLALLLPAMLIAVVLAVSVWFWGVLGFSVVGWFVNRFGYDRGGNTSRAENESPLACPANVNGDGARDLDEDGEVVKLEEPGPDGKRVVH